MDQGYRTAGLSRQSPPNRQPVRADWRWIGASGLNPIRVHVVKVAEKTALTSAALCLNVRLFRRGQKGDKFNEGFGKGLWRKSIQ